MLPLWGERRCTEGSATPFLTLWTMLSVTTGAPTQNTKLPLPKWFAALFLVANSSKGLSSVAFGRRIGARQQAAISPRSPHVGTCVASMARNALDTSPGACQMGR